MKILDIPRSGSYADKTSSKNRAGQYVRNRRSPVQPIGTGRRAVARANFGSASSSWAGITDAQRAAWATFADGVPYIDRLGQSIKLTGHQMFVAVNSQLLNCGSGVSETPPGDTTVPVLSDVVLSAAITGGVLSADFTSTGTAADFILCAVAPLQSAGRSFVGRWWQAQVFPGNVTAAEVYDQFVAEFGALVEGRKVFMKLTPVNQYGVTGAPTTVSAVVEA